MYDLDPDCLDPYMSAQSQSGFSIIPYATCPKIPAQDAVKDLCLIPLLPCLKPGGGGGGGTGLNNWWGCSPQVQICDPMGMIQIMKMGGQREFFF